MRGRINRTKGKRTKRMTHTCHNRNERSQTFKDVWALKRHGPVNYSVILNVRQQKDLQMALINERNGV